jgi:ubiquinone/menaquinone biosynthesis C-methylase UbiE
MDQSIDPYQPLEQNLKYGDVVNRWLLLRPRQRITRLLRGSRVLDVCCGTGNLAALLVAAGCQVVAVDSSATMLSHARRKHLPAEFKKMDAAHLPFDHEFDAAVISIALHEMTPQVRQKVWESMQVAVRPTGRLIALDFAVPGHNTLLARFIGGLIEQDERGTLAYQPEHYANYQEFMRNGGLLSWMQKQSQPVAADYRYWGGTLAVIVTKPSAT